MIKLMKLRHRLKNNEGINLEKLTTHKLKIMKVRFLKNNLKQIPNFISQTHP